MIIGEQPGDQEDLAGRPFVGPAGELLNSTLRELGIYRENLYLTNAVKHFKWKPSPKGVNHRGSTRLHDKANRKEVAACRPWLWGEIARVSPSVILTLGDTAGQSLAGAEFRVLRDRGEVEPSPDLHFAGKVFATVHTSYLLRLPRDRRDVEREAFVEDLRSAFSFAGDLE
jgi:DNA polymerase